MSLFRSWEKADWEKWEKVHIKGAQIVIFTWVMGDGWGDYYTQLDAAEVLRECLPEAEICLVTLVHEERKLPQETHPFPQYVTSAKELSPTIYEMIGKADILLQLPTYFPETEQLLSQLSHKPHHLLIGETGFINHYPSDSGAHCMGLHVLEKGLLIKNLPKTQSVAGFNLDYTKTDLGKRLYLQILLKAYEQMRTPLHIQLPSLGFLIEEIEELKPLFEQYGVGEIEILFQGSICAIPLSKPGKKLVFHYSGHQKQPLFLQAMAETDLLVGCTGDGSIREALAIGKPFFYDPPEHKLAFFKDLILLAEERLQAFPETIEFLQLSFQRNLLYAERMGVLLQSVNLKEGFTALSTIIRNEYAINPFLSYLIKKTLHPL